MLMPPAEMQLSGFEMPQPNGSAETAKPSAHEESASEHTTTFVQHNKPDTAEP